MKRQKRDMTERAFHKGYQAGITGKLRDLCPHEQPTLRFQWMAGWREGRADKHDGLSNLYGT